MALDIQQEIAALPTLPQESGDIVTASDPSPLQVASRLGKQLLRINASYQELNQRQQELAEQLKERDRRLEEAADRERNQERQLRRTAEVAIQILDALDFLHEALATVGDTLATEAESARRDSLRRLATIGVTEIPATGQFDGSLHEGVGTVPATEAVPSYHIAEVVRRGYQMGTHVLRRTEVITAK